MTVFNIKVYFDTVCPWCYIGERSLEKAISLYQKTYPNGRADAFIFTWSPFYLAPDAPMQGEPITDRILAKNGEVMARGIGTRLKRVGEEYGINFTLTGKTGNSALSHRLVYLAGKKSPELQKEVLDEIYRAHFEGDGDITSRELMIRIGISVGLHHDDIEECLDSLDVKEEIDRRAKFAKEVAGVKHVPTIELNGTRIEGSDDPHEFYAALVEIKETENAP